ncbi:hypothetical protein AURDEDRAFT_172112 [Auricularia subglabra TFB-10046 SS5]|nr:hypothetical protein AURDEDRAFT_172112 [Auricularia subglabra TFB-10046 SS5]
MARRQRSSATYSVRLVESAPLVDGPSNVAEYDLPNRAPPPGALCPCRDVGGLQDVDAVRCLDCASFIPAVPLLDESIALVRDDALVPVLNRVLASLDVSSAPVWHAALVPVVPLLKVPLVPVLNRALAPLNVTSAPVRDAVLVTVMPLLDGPTAPVPDESFPRALDESFACALDESSARALYGPFAKVRDAALVHALFALSFMSPVLGLSTVEAQGLGGPLCWNGGAYAFFPSVETARLAALSAGSPTSRSVWPDQRAAAASLPVPRSFALQTFALP